MVKPQAMGEGQGWGDGKEQERPFVLADYMGTWFELARSVNEFEARCQEDTTVATYTAIDATSFLVENVCVDRHSGALRSAKGKAWVDSSGRIRVSFAWLPTFLLRHLPLLSAPYDVVYFSGAHAVVRSGTLWWVLGRGLPGSTSQRRLDELVGVATAPQRVRPPG